MSDIITSAGFVELSNAKRKVAHALVNDRRHCREAWNAAGAAVEFELKALIIRQRRWNAWPSRESHPELYTHDLRTLFVETGIQPASIPPSMRGALKVAFDWDRSHDYTSGRMPRIVARHMVEAVFGEEGVCEWLRSL
jgi:hypothetical protein